METKTVNPFERAFAGVTKPYMMSAIAILVARQIKNGIVQELAEQASNQIKEIDQTRDLLVQGVYAQFHEQVHLLKKGDRAEGLETLSAVLPSPMSSTRPSSSPLRPLGYFLPAPNSEDMQVLQRLERQVFLSDLTAEDMVTLIINCLQSATRNELTSVEVHWTSDEASCIAWHWVVQLSDTAKLHLALHLLNRLLYAELY